MSEMLAFFFAILGLWASTHGTTIPGSWGVCKLSDPDLNGCLKSAIARAVSDLMPGNPALGVEQFEPLNIKLLAISKGAGPVSVNLELSDLSFRNLKYFQINTLTNDWKKLTAKVTFPKGLHIVGKYKTDGHVLVLPIKGEGQADITLDNVVVNGKFAFVEKAIDGKTYYHVDRLDFDFDSSQLHIKMEGLFGGDKALGDNMNKFLNDNWRLLLAELKKPIAESLAKELKVITNHVFSKFTKDEISPA